ncbi:TetR/AcrR family transcriptional regulator [Rhodobacteraceae bacterium RKSG542]|uniref:TetR/AcrR family transcriptional regulator n=1 Tax=Pseudovibrio flavus TaxID=2529854 RepID=UPI0012BC7168|nr:TetR/AcrR family transcriptional regulator [Pseudovibrio flavus]MTI17478.1 TetR/AcrR family transcriptional regulator [Pseudovibrio flavus]
MHFVSISPYLEKSPPSEGFNVAELLEARANSLSKRKKRVRTRAKLLAVAAREIEKVGYDSLTIDHLVSAAGMVRGTFYLYFNSRADIIKAVLWKYWALMRIHRPRGGGLGLRESIHRANSYTVMLAALNPGLLEAREILLREDQQIFQRMESINRVWAERIVRDLARRERVHDDEADLAFLRMKVRAVIHMSDALLADVHRMAKWDASEQPPNLDLVIRVMDDLWFRSLFMKTS